MNPRPPASAHSSIKSFGLAALLLMVPVAARATSFTTLHTISARDPSYPQSPLLPDRAGNLYGCTEGGGSTGTGAVFRLNKLGKLKVLHAFDGAGGGYGPRGSLVRNAAGTLFGVASGGGASDLGLVFSIARNGTFAVLHSFAGGTDGANPGGGLIADKQGNLFGTTGGGGTSGFGTIFEITAGGVEITLHQFTSGEGNYPAGPLVHDHAGNFYGTTTRGGTSNDGTVFEMTPNLTVATLHSFDGTDGFLPSGGVIFGKGGVLFGTTYAGGASNDGTVFKLAHKGKLTTLHHFTGSDGQYLFAGLTEDKSGNLFGTAGYGGAHGFGSVFEISAAGGFASLHDFSNSDGAYPETALTRDAAGNLYGATFEGGGSDFGTIFRIVP